MNISSLFNESKPIGIWGLGYLSYFTFAKYSKLGLACRFIDIGINQMEDLKERFDSLKKAYWNYANVAEGELDHSELVAIEDVDISNMDVHFICIPIENDGIPNLTPLKMVVEKFKELKPGHCPLLIVESSFGPGTTDDVVVKELLAAGKRIGEDYLLAVAPRRQWGADPNANGKKIGRLCGSPDTASLVAGKEILSLVEEKVTEVKSFYEVELARCLENTIQYVNQAFSNQLFQAYPHLDVNKVLDLAGTHPDVKSMHPTASVGGFNYPISASFLLDKSEVPEALSLIHEAMRADYSMTQKVAERILSENIKSVLVLGFSYKEDATLYLNSPFLKFQEILKDKGVEVYVNDPMFSPEELHKHTGAKVLDFPDDIGSVEGVLFLTPHSQYSRTPFSKLKNHFEKVKLVIDNTELWKNYDFSDLKVKYLSVGRKGWV